MNTITTILAALDGKKTYIGLALGAAVIVANHFGATVPGVPPSVGNEDWLTQLWSLYMGSALRSALAKVGPTA
jgi:hypothetical protein